MNKLREHWNETNDAVLKRKSVLERCLGESSRWDEEYKEVDAWLGHMETTLDNHNLNDHQLKDYRVIRRFKLIFPRDVNLLIVDWLFRLRFKGTRGKSMGCKDNVNASFLPTLKMTLLKSKDLEIKSILDIINYVQGKSLR